MTGLWFCLMIVVCYFVGNINFARAIARVWKHDDITKRGSGNPGAMNVLRVYGIGPFIATVLCEGLKAAVPAISCGYIFASQGLFEVAFFTAGFSVILGHNFPVVFKFKGGKGIMCIIGMFCFSPLWYLGLIFAFLYLVFLYFVDYAFLASLIYVFLLTLAWIIYLCILQPYLWWVAMIILIVNFLLAIFMHRSNIARFVKGAENHTGFKEKLKKLFAKKQKVEAESQTTEKEIVIEDENLSAQSDHVDGEKQENNIDSTEKQNNDEKN